MMLNIKYATAWAHYDRTMSMNVAWSSEPSLRNYKPCIFLSLVTRANSTNVLDEGLRIRETGRRMNSKVKLVKQGGYRK
jgi:hypothetical protein